MTAMTSMLVGASGMSQIKSPLGDALAKFQTEWKQYRVHWSRCRVGNGENKLVAKAGLGRCSGAIHGGRLKKARRRHPSEINQDEDKESELDTSEDHGAQARGAYGDDFEDERSLTEGDDYIERDEESLVDRFHSDGTSDNRRDETQFRVSYSRDTDDQEQESASVVVDDNIRHSNLAQQSDERKDTPNVITGTGKKIANVVLRRSEQPGASPQEHNGSGVEAVTVFDGSGKATVSKVLSYLLSEQLSVAKNGAGVGHSATEKASSNSGSKEEVMGGTKQWADDEEIDRQQSERGTDTSGVPVVQYAMESKGKVDGSRNGSTRPSLQRRSSRGRKRKSTSSFGNDSPPVIIFSEDVASVAATIPTIPEAAGSDSKVSPSKSGSEPGSFAAQEMGGRPFHESNLRAYDSKTIARGSYGVSDLLATSDNMRVQAPTGEDERPARLPDSLVPASATAVVLERAVEHVADLQPAVLDMNKHNGHIKPNTTFRKKEKNSPAGIPQLVRPNRLHNPIGPLHASAQETSKDALVTGSVGTAENTLTLATIRRTTSTTPPSPSFPLKLVTDLPVKVVKDLPSKVAELPVKVVKDLPVKVSELPVVKDLLVVKEIPAKISEIPTVVAEIPTKIVVETVQILKTQVVEPVVEILPDSVVEQMGAVVEQVSSQVDEVSSKVSEHVTKVSNQVSESVSSTAAQVTQSVTSTVTDVTESVQSTAAQVTETVQTRAAQVSESVSSTATKVSSKAAEVSNSIVDFLTFDDESASDDEFETFKTSDSPEFRGMQGLQNYQVLQDGQGMLFAIYDFYIYMLKKPLPQFACGMFAAPILLSVVFTLLYMPDCQGLALDETARTFFNSAAGDDASMGGLSLSWMTLFQVFMFSLSLSTGLQPELSPLSPYTLVLANINALFAQLIFVFLSGAVFARLSQPSQPVRCSNVALVCPSLAQRRRRVDSSATKVLMARYVLVGPQPCELVDVKVDFTYKYNTLTRSGSFFRATQSLKLVRSEIAYLNQGMLVRHIIDESSPLYRRTPEMLLREDAIFTLSVVGLERSSMQSVFHVQHYCVCDNHVIWDAEFEDMMLISKKNNRIVDHSKLSLWRSL